MTLDGATYNPRWNGDAKKYLQAKLKILTDPKGFGITITEREMEHLKTLKTQVAIDNGILSIINSRWG
jgi:hypothetical protein